MEIIVKLNFFLGAKFFFPTLKNVTFFLLSKILREIPVSPDGLILACPKKKNQFDNDFHYKNTWILSYFEENLETWRLGWDWAYQNKALLWTAQSHPKHQNSKFSSKYDKIQVFLA